MSENELDKWKMKTHIIEVNGDCGPKWMERHSHLLFFKCINRGVNTHD